LYVDAFLADEHAAHAQREQAAAALRSQQARLPAQIQRCAVVHNSPVGRLTAAIRPTSEPCSNHG
jgi:hypothetical protein